MSSLHYFLNQKRANEVYLSTVAKGIDTFTQAQKTILESIIYQCPAAGGRAVYIARNLYYFISPNIHYDDDALCAAQNVTWRTASHTQADIVTLSQGDTPSKIETAYNLYPNPANKEVTLALNLSEEGNVKLLISNTLGLEVMKHTITDSKTTFSFSTAKLGEGIYYYQLIQNEKMVGSGKMLIVH